MASKTAQASPRFDVENTVLESQDQTPRFVIDTNGQFIYVSKGLKSFLSAVITDITDRHANEILDFADASEAYYMDSGIKGSKNAKDPKDFTFIRPGYHAVQFKDKKKSSETRSFQFDWIALGNGTSYLVATADEDEAMGFESPARLKNFVQQIADLQATTQDARQDNTKPKTAPKKKIAEKPKTEVKPENSKQQETARLRQEENELFLNMSSELQAVMEDNGQFIRFNGNFNRILGYMDDDLLDKNFIDVVHNDDRTHIRNALFSIALDTSSSNFSPAIHFETRMIGKTGGMFWIDWQLKNVKGKVYALGRDVTDIKNNESALLKKELKLREAQALANMGHWKWEIGEEDISWSEELYKIFDRDPSEFQPTINNLKDVIHRRDIGRITQAFQRAIIEKRNYDIDFRVYKNDGEIRHIRCEGRCEFDDNEEVIALFGIMQDVTERLQNERALQEAKEEAEAAYAAKSRFLANMSHELRTPLNAVIGFSEMMQRQLLGPIGNEKYLDYITGIRESGEHLLDLITDILDMSRIEAGKYELVKEDINTSKLGRLAVHMMEGRAVDSKLTLSIEVEKEDRMLCADRRALMQILLNLLSNAVKFTEAGGTVKLKIADNDTGVTFTVVDSGIGIPANKIATITRPFEQVESDYSRNYDGSGLGLAITKDLAELHGGKIRIESELGHGTSVTISIPDTK